MIPFHTIDPKKRAADCNCGLIGCVCSLIREHVPGCRFREAMRCVVAIACEPHGYDVCPICDPCTCPPRRPGALPYFMSPQAKTAVMVGPGVKICASCESLISRPPKRSWRTQGLRENRRITAAKGLLWRDGLVVPLPEADRIAEAHGYTCAEQLVRYMSGARAVLIPDQKTQAYNLDPMPKPKPQKPNPIPSTRISDRALARAVEYGEGYGNITAIASRMSAITGEPVTRQMVGRWLNKDPERRQQPSFGNALLLLFVIEQLNQEPSMIDIVAIVQELQTKPAKSKK